MCGFTEACTFRMQAIIEVDGPSEFSLNSRLPLGRTVARKCMLEACGHHVRSIPYYQWAALHGAEMQRQYLVQLLHTIPIAALTVHDAGLP